MTAVTAVVLAYGDQPWLARCVEALLASSGAEVDVVVVDNGCSDTHLVQALARDPRVQVLTPGTNLGYAGGCNAGAAHGRGEVLAFVNSDAVVDPGALLALAEVVAEPEVGLATASVRLGDDPDRLNTAGNPIHLTGLSWSGHYGEPADLFAARRAVASVSGACFAARRGVWDSLGGFDEAWFAYNEDADLSLRAWQAGFEVAYVPDAVVVHHYEFSRHPRKSYLLERNRLLNVLTLFQARTLLLLAPVLAAFEVAMLAVSLREGWWRQKIDGYRWILRHRHMVLQRRRRLTAVRRCSDRELAWLLTSRLEPANVPLPPGVAVANALVAGYWWAARRML